MGEFQLKAGTPNYVRGAVVSGKYLGPIVTTREVTAQLGPEVPPAAVTDRLALPGLRTMPVSDADARQCAREVLQEKFREALPATSSWEEFEKLRRSLGPTLALHLGNAAIGAAVAGARALWHDEPVDGRRMLNAALLAGGRSVAVHTLGSILMRGIERVAIRAGGWSQGAIRGVCQWASPAAALAGFLFDVMWLGCRRRRGELTTDEFWRETSCHFGAAVGGLLGAVAMFYLLRGEALWVAVLAALVVGAWLAYVGGDLGGRAYDAYLDYRERRELGRLILAPELCAG